MTDKTHDEALESGQDAAERERDELRDRLLRTAAEFDNYRKRVERERRDLSDFVSADVVRDLLPIVDDLDRALAAGADAGEGRDVSGALHRGVELIHRRMLDLLRKRNVEPIEVVGADFDPEWHESVAHEPADGRREGVITEELRRGYRIGGKLLRPAMVKVTKA